MFVPGEFYLERVTTGTVAFDGKGIPSTTPMKHWAAFGFEDQKTVADLKGLLITHDMLEPGVSYMRLFQAPKATFDAHGALRPLEIITAGFYKVDDDFCRIAKQNVDTYKLVDELPKEVLDLFKDEEPKKTDL